MRQQSTATRSIRRAQRGARPPALSSTPDVAALQIFLFRVEAFVGTELFSAGAPVTLGRSRRADLVLDGDAVSRLHCRLTVEGDDVIVEDLGSGNGTFVNRQRVVGRRIATALDTITVGPYTLKVRALKSELKKADEPAAAREPTTRIEAILEVSGNDDMPISVELSVDQRLYQEAVRRRTGREAAAAPPPPASMMSAAPDVQLRSEIHDDSTMMSPEEISVSMTPTGSSLDPEVEARLRDLDDLIASLDARLEGGRKPSMVPWSHDGSGASERSVRTFDGPQVSMSTREFARDLASRLALDGQVVESKKADVIPLETRRKTGAPAPAAPSSPPPVAVKANTPEAVAARTPTRGVPVVTPPRQMMADEDAPETELMDRDLPPVQKSIPMPVISEAKPPPSLPPPPPRAETKSSRPLPAARRIPLDGPPLPVGVRPAKPKNPNAREARLLTPSSMRVDVQAFVNQSTTEPEDSGVYDDVWTYGSNPGDLPEPRRVQKASPPPLPKHSKHSVPVVKPSAPKTPRHVTLAKPKSRIDDFDPSRKDARADEFDGLEVSARALGKIIDVAVIAKSGEQYILGHNTPQGGVAPGKAHLGLRLVRVNADRTVDLVFPKDVGGHLVRGSSTVMFSELTEGRKYSCLRLEPQDIATIILGEGRNVITYHLRFLRRQGSLVRALKKATGAR